MKNRQRLQIGSVLLTLFCCFFIFSPLIFFGESPKPRPLAILATKATPPPEILAALEKCETDRLAIVAANAGIVVANDSLKAATADKAKATAAAAADYANFLALWSQYYGPTPPPPTPPVPPEPPVPVPPVPPAPTAPTLLLIAATGDWCDACNAVKADTLPGLQKAMGDKLTVVDYSSGVAKKAYPESVLVPRWVLTRPDGKVEKKIGYMDLDKVNAWLGAKR